jgi:hypothetical protein
MLRLGDFTLRLFDEDLTYFNSPIEFPKLAMSLYSNKFRSWYLTPNHPRLILRHLRGYIKDPIPLSCSRFHVNRDKRPSLSADILMITTD